MCGLIPSGVAFAIRIFVKEPERWKAVASEVAPTISELFTPKFRKVTISGFAMALIALLTWWSCSNFIPAFATELAQKAAQGQDPKAIQKLSVEWRGIATNYFNLGGLIGTLLTVPAALYLGRKKMFGIYFLLSGLAIFAAFGISMPSETRLMMYFPIGLTVFGVFGSFTYYLPELFPTRLRGTGAGFCYNAGRILASPGPFLVGYLSKEMGALNALFWVGVVPIIGLLALPLVIETKGKILED